MAEPIRVTHVALSLDVGGLERIVVDLVRQGQELGQQVSVVCLERRGTLAHQVEDLKARLVCVNKKSGLKFKTIGRMKAVLRELHPDVVHTHQVGALFYTGTAARSVGVPVVVHTEHINNIRKSSSGRLRRLRMSWLWWWAARYAARFFCVSEDIAQEMRDRRLVPTEKLCVLLNGIDTVRFAGSSEATALREEMGIAADSPVIGTVGRLNEVKSQDLLLRAFAEIKKRIPEAHLLLVGDGPMREALGELAVKLRIAPAVHFTGYQAQPERFLHAMNVFALTSRLEGLPLAILEAWAAGLPVVASAVGGVPDLVQHEGNGLLFPSGDETMLVTLLQKLIRDPQRAHRLGAAGRREVVARYSLTRMAEDYQRHYLQLLRDSTKRMAR
jgi:sugar transferase (PEP-CTERM/EpsH1 system associated)